MLWLEECLRRMASDTGISIQYRFGCLSYIWKGELGNVVKINLSFVVILSRLGDEQIMPCLSLVASSSKVLGQSSCPLH